jgi:hypothetical protein
MVDSSEPDNGPLLLGVSWGLTSLATVFLGLRLYCKLSTGRRLWWDDWIMLAGWVRHPPCLPTTAPASRLTSLLLNRSWFSPRTS